MPKRSNIVNDTKVIVPRARELQDRARELQDRTRRLKRKSRKAHAPSGGIHQLPSWSNQQQEIRNYAYLECARLIDVLDRILDKGLIVEPWQRVAVQGIDLRRRNGRVKIASLQTHLRNEVVAGRAKHSRLRPLSGPRLPIARPANFIDMLDRILDKGIVVDSWERIHVLGIGTSGLDTRLVLASIQTHLLYEDSHVLRCPPKKVRG